MTDLKLTRCVAKALIDLEIPDTISDDDFRLLQDLSRALKSVSLASEALGCHDATSLTAEGTPKFPFETLATDGSSLSIEMLQALKTEFKRGDPQMWSHS